MAGPYSASVGTRAHLERASLCAHHLVITRLTVESTLLYLLVWSAVLQGPLQMQDQKRFRYVDEQIQGSANKFQCLGCFVHFCSRSARQHHATVCTEHVRIDNEDPNCQFLQQADRAASRHFASQMHDVAVVPAHDCGLLAPRVAAHLRACCQGALWTAWN